MGRASKHELKKRQAEALQMLSDGYGTSESASLLSDKWGVSRKTALRAIKAAHLEMVADLDEVDKHHLLSRLINQTEQSIRGSMKTKNYGAALAGIKLMHQMVIESVAASPKRRTWVNHY